MILILIYLAVLFIAADFAYRQGYKRGFKNGILAAKRAFHEVYYRRENETF